MNQKTLPSWDKFLNPETLRSNLLAASIFITSYEVLKDSIIDQILSFYTHGFDQNGPIVSESYKSKVLALDSKSNSLRASIAWLKANGVINAKDEQTIADLTQHRNEVAHQLPTFLSQADHNVELSKLEDLIELVKKIDRWWIVNVELAIQDEIDVNLVDQERIMSGHMMFLHLLLTASSGADSDQLYKEFLKQTGQDTQAQDPAGN
jgi:hypothetical protein